jgi:uncharacterized protein (DUF2062 family)
MLFKRRERAGLGERVRVALWPRTGWRRSASYYRKRTLRLSGTPYAIAIGAAAGAFASFTPFMGFHIFIALAASWLLRGNLIAAALGTAIGNPLTFPFIWAATYQLGTVMKGGSLDSLPERLDRNLADRSLWDILPLIKPMMIGALPLGLAAGAAVYLLVFQTVGAYQRQRRDRLASKSRIADDLVRPTAAPAEKVEEA